MSRTSPTLSDFSTCADPQPTCLREELLKEKMLTIALSNPKEVTNQDLNSSNNVLAVELG